MRHLQECTGEKAPLNFVSPKRKRGNGETDGIPMVPYFWDRTYRENDSLRKKNIYLGYLYRTAAGYTCGGSFILGLPCFAG